MEPAPTAVFPALMHLLQSWPGYIALSAVLKDYPNLKIYAAGGVVRDLLLGKSTPPKDFDFLLAGESVDGALALLAEEGRLVETPFGSPRWYPPGQGSCYCDAIPIVRFHNGLWPCADIVDALNQFDFTANAVAFDLRTGQFYDPQNGRRDLLRQTMRAVRFDYPDEPISAATTLTRNAVLWFRILHYAAKLDFEFEPVTRRWLQAHRHYAECLNDFTATFFPPELGRLEQR